MVRKKFILFQLFLIFMILLSVWGVVIPYATGTARDVQKVNVEVTLAVVRKAICAYYAEHRGVHPGFPGGNSSKPPTEEALIAQLFGKTNPKGDTVEDGPCGPYLGEYQGFPANPLNNKSRVAVFLKNPVMPAFNGEYGWVYTAATGNFDPVTQAAEGDDRGSPRK